MLNNYYRLQLAKSEKLELPLKVCSVGLNILQKLLNILQKFTQYFAKNFNKIRGENHIFERKNSFTLMLIQKLIMMVSIFGCIYSRCGLH